MTSEEDGSLVYVKRKVPTRKLVRYLEQLNALRGQKIKMRQWAHDGAFAVVEATVPRRNLGKIPDYARECTR